MAKIVSELNKHQKIFGDENLKKDVKEVKISSCQVVDHVNVVNRKKSGISKERFPERI